MTENWIHLILITIRYKFFIFVNLYTPDVMDSSSEDHNHSNLFGEGSETKSISSEDSSSSDRKKSKSSSKHKEYNAVARKKSRTELQMGKHR